MTTTPTPTTGWTRRQVEALAVGDALEMTCDTRNSLPLPEARWGTAEKVVRLSYRGDDIAGLAFVCFATTFGDNATISGSIKEGEGHYRLVADFCCQLCGEPIGTEFADYCDACASRAFVRCDCGNRGYLAHRDSNLLCPRGAK